MEVSIDEPLNVDWDGNELCFPIFWETDDDVISQRLENEVEIKLLGKQFPSFLQRSRRLSNCGSGLGETGGKEKTQKEVADIWEFHSLIFPGWKKDHEEIEEGNCEV